MARIEPFEKHPFRYEDWFERNGFAYESELRAIRAQLPESKKGVEIGVGSGRFAGPLGIRYGVEPSAKMREIARSRGIEAIDGIAEDLPYDDAQFDLALMVTTICFLDDLKAAFEEAHRILKPNGAFIIGFIDEDSPIGKLYWQHKNESVFYKIAVFYSMKDVVSLLKKTGFGDFEYRQTIFHNLADVNSVEPVKEGYGEGSFVVVKALK